LQLSHSVEVNVTPAFAWSYRTDIATWNDPPARFTLEGRFENGARGTTLLPGQDPLYWHIRDVKPGESFVVEMQLDRATLCFEWYFEELPGSRTKLTQQIVLSGENAHAYAAQVESGFGRNLADGMKRLASEMVSGYLAEASA
jgi:hypothetical protein